MTSAAGSQGKRRFKLNWAAVGAMTAAAAVVVPLIVSKIRSPEEIFADRIMTDNVRECKKAPWRDVSRIQAAQMVIKCRIVKPGPADYLTAATFYSKEKLNAFMLAEVGSVGSKRKDADCTKGARFDYSGTWHNRQNQPVGFRVCRRSEPGGWRIVWSFTNDGWVEEHGLPFLVIVESSDPAELIKWWEKIPV